MKRGLWWFTLMACLSLCGCKNGRELLLSGGDWRLPKLNGNIVSIHLSQDLDRLIAVTTQSNTHRSVFLVGPKHQSKLIAKGEYLAVIPIARQDRFVVAKPNGKMTAFTLYDFEGNSIASADLEASMTWPSCEAIEAVLVCAADRPELTEDSPDVDPLGSSAFAIIDMERKTTKLVVHSFKTYFADPSSKWILLGDQLNENNGNLRVTFYDLAGHEKGESKEMHGTRLSASGRYYIPQLHEGGLPWEVYDHKTNTPIMAFHNGKVDYYENGWNPVNDDLLVVRSTESPTIQICNIRISKCSAIPGEGEFEEWTSDGSKIVVFDNQKVRVITPPN